MYYLNAFDAACRFFAGFFLLRSSARYISTETSFRLMALLMRATSLNLGAICGARDEIIPARFLGVFHFLSCGTRLEELISTFNCNLQKTLWKHLLSPTDRAILIPTCQGARVGVAC